MKNIIEKPVLSVIVDDIITEDEQLNVLGGGEGACNSNLCVKNCVQTCTHSCTHTCINTCFLCNNCFLIRDYTRTSSMIDLGL